MSIEDLREEIAVELEALDTIVQELVAVRNDVAIREPTVRDQFCEFFREPGQGY